MADYEAPQVQIMGSVTELTRIDDGSIDIDGV